MIYILIILFFIEFFYFLYKNHKENVRYYEQLNIRNGIVKKIYKPINFSLNFGSGTGDFNLFSGSLSWIGTSSKTINLKL